MIFNIKPEERQIFSLLRDAAKELDYPTYVVGGYVRDRLISRESKDMDIVCVGDGIKLAQQFASMMRPVPRVTVFRRFGTAMLRVASGMEIEFVGARKESYSENSRKPAVENGSLEDDQNRRDFTINALAVSLNDSNYGEIIDPFNGLQHLKDKVIQTPLEPGKTFSDDPLRMMRAIRFATQLEYDINPETYAALSKYKNRLRIISKERITTEFNKILLSRKPSIGLKMLEETGLLELFLPEVVALKGVEVKNGISHKDNFYHTLEVVDNIAPTTKNLWLRWAALLHDIAKPPTKRFNPEVGWTFHGHEVLGAKWVPRIFKSMKLPLDHKMKFVQKMVRLHLRPIALTKDDISDSAVRRLCFDAGDNIDELMLLCKADITSKNDYKVKRYLENYDRLQKKIQEIEEKDKLRNWQPPISGEVIMSTFGLKPCRLVGEIKTAIREAILEGHIPNEYNAAFDYMLGIAKEYNLDPVC